MANRKTTEKATTQEQASTLNVPPGLAKKEEAAIEELQARQSGGTGKSYRLANPNTQYTDPATKWTLAGNQSKPLPEGYANSTWARIKEGFLIEGSTQNEGSE